MLLKNANVLNGCFEFVKTDITVENGKFVSLSPKDSEAGLDLSNKYIVPGLIDIHIHGANGFQITDDKKEAVSEVASFLLKSGTTTFCPTISSLSYDGMHNVMANIKEYIEDGEAYTKIGGIHLEGPFVSKAYKGALAEQAIRNPDIVMFKEWNEFCDGRIKIISMAPELPGAMEFTCILPQSECFIRL